MDCPYAGRRYLAIGETIRKGDMFPSAGNFAGLQETLQIGNRVDKADWYVRRIEKEIECGDVFFANKGQSSNAYPTIWMVCSSQSALEPNGVVHGKDSKWICLLAPAGTLVDSDPETFFKRGMSHTQWHGMNSSGTNHILYPGELREMIYLGNFWDWSKEAIKSAAAGERASVKTMFDGKKKQ